MNYHYRIPSPPSVNNLYANIPGRGRIKSERYKAWLNAAGWAVSPRPAAPMSGPVAVEIVLGSRRLDIDNGSKACLDLLVKMAVIADDKQVIDLHIRRAGPSKEAVLSVREIEARAA